MFPQLVAGPIVRYLDVEAQLEKREHSLPMCVAGVRCFSAGLAKKVLLGNTVGMLWERIAALPESSRSVLCAWGGIVCFSLQIYFDFSGYSDMAIGLGRIFGFRLPENFNYPYVSQSATEFWRRWHITLSTFFREYVYIPLGGNRKGKVRTYLNLLVVWLLTGLWHGAGWNFILWGLYWFFVLCAEKLFFAQILEKLPRAVRHAYALFAIAFSWLIFAFDGSDATLTFSAGVLYLKNMLGLSGQTFVSASDVTSFLRAIPFFAVAAFACTPTAKKIFYAKYTGRAVHEGALSLLCVGGVILCVAFIASSSYNPFLYFRF